MTAPAEDAPPTSFKDIMAKIRSRATPETPRAAAPAPPAKVDIPGDDLALKRVSRLEAENLELKERVGKLDPAAETDAAFARQIRKLYSEGKKMDALGLLAQADPTGEMESLLATYLEAPTATAEAALAAKVDEALDASKKALEASAKLQTADAERAAAAQKQGQLSFALSALDGAHEERRRIAPVRALHAPGEPGRHRETAVRTCRSRRDRAHGARSAARHRAEGRIRRRHPRPRPAPHRRRFRGRRGGAGSPEGIEQLKLVEARFKKGAKEQPRAAAEPPEIPKG